ncbi:MAG TPA: EAL domain-containing protein [Candidatus Limnocylindria bacterium]|nr:EAL domain-containing protein [Candidatus Limnocylindria bacterium]
MTAKQPEQAPPQARVWALVALIGGAALVLAVGVLSRVPPLDPHWRLPWWAMAAAFWAVEAQVIHFHFRRGAHTFSLNELPLVVGFFLAAPLELVAAQAIGSAVALAVNRRQPPVKLAFNIGSFALSSVIGLLVFHLLGSGPLTDPSRWLAAFVAVAISNLVGVLTVASVISISEGSLGAPKLRQMIGVSSVVAITNTSIALLAVIIIVADTRAVWLLALPVATLFLGYRAFIGARQQHESLELLYESTRILQRTPELDSALVQLLSHSRTMFRAEQAEIVLFPSAPGDSYLITSVAEGRTSVMAEAPASTWRPVHQHVIEHGKAFLLNTTTLDLEDDRDVRDAMIAPLGTEGGVIGAMLIANRMGDVSTFTAEDLRLFATVANHAGTALENGQLERSLAKLSVLQDELKHQAFHDGLTQLANRGLFSESVNARLAATERGKRSVVMFVDLDDFKFVNDMYGHPAGDAMLVEVAARLQACTRASDLTARLGGDEFAILVDDGPDLGNAERVAGRIAEILRQPFQIGEVQTHVSASIGIAAGSSGDSAEDLLRQADVAMYSAKAGGKGRWVVYKPSMLRTVRSRHDVGAELQLAVDRGEFQLRYQPIVALASGGIVGAEALVRWNHPSRGEVGPDEFIGTAEENAIIVPIGRWVLNEACREAAGWGQQHAGETPWVAANLSARQLLHPTLLEDVDAAIAASGLSPASLILEVTESVLLHDADAAIDVLSELRGRGIQVALDDFGTGYSSLSYLHRFPIDILKIAQGFVDVDDANDGRWILAQAIISLGNALGLKVIAEGVERRAQVQRLKNAGCEFAQGFFFARPLNGETLAAEFARDNAQRLGSDRMARSIAAEIQAA